MGEPVVSDDPGANLERPAWPESVGRCSSMPAHGNGYFIAHQPDDPPACQEGCALPDAIGFLAGTIVVCEACGQTHVARPWRASSTHGDIWNAESPRQRRRREKRMRKGKAPKPPKASWP